MITVSAVHGQIGNILEAGQITNIFMVQVLTETTMSGWIHTYRCPNSVATCIGCVTRDKKVPGSPPVWVASVQAYTSGA